jgi:hypothetical protein
MAAGGASTVSRMGIIAILLNAGVGQVIRLRIAKMVSWIEMMVSCVEIP